MPDGGEHAFNRVGCPQVVPVLGREVVEGQQRVLVLGQAGDRLLVLGPILLSNDIRNRSFRILGAARLRQPAAILT